MDFTDEDTQRTHRENGAHKSDHERRISMLEDETARLRDRDDKAHDKLDAILVGIGTTNSNFEAALAKMNAAQAAMDKRGWTHWNIRLALLALFVMAGAMLWMATHPGGA